MISLEFPGEARDSETTIATDIFLTGHSANPEVLIKKEIETVLLGYNFPQSTKVDIRNKALGLGGLIIAQLAKR